MGLMIFTIAILKEVMIMNNPEKQTSYLFEPWITKLFRFKDEKDNKKVKHPFSVILYKEIADHIWSWRFIILIVIIALTCFGSMHTGIANLRNAIKPEDPQGAFLFLKLFTATDGTLPSFVVFMGFLGPLLGISMGFDAVNSEHNNRTISRVLSQPIYRDYLLNAKFLAALIVISVMFFALAFFVMGFGLISIGIPPTAQEFLRIVFFVILSIIYVAFWLNLSILFSVQFRQPATSALSGIAVWLFFTVFYGMIVNMIAKAVAPPNPMGGDYQNFGSEELKIALSRIMPNQLYSEATTSLLMPSVRSLGPLTNEQVYGAIPGPLPLGQSVLLVWPEITGLIAATVLCFVLSYISFMRREIRSR
jgi:ABC-2 type transport system permease protein